MGGVAILKNHPSVHSDWPFRVFSHHVDMHTSSTSVVMLEFPFLLPMMCENQIQLLYSSLTCHGKEERCCTVLPRLNLAFIGYPIGIRREIVLSLELRTCIRVSHHDLNCMSEWLKVNGRDRL